MLYSGLRRDALDYREDPSRGMMLVMMSVGTSIDALAVGLSLALTGSPIIFPSLVIAVVASLMTYVGLKLGLKLGALFGQSVQLLGGLILIGSGVRVLMTHKAI